MKNAVMVVALVRSRKTYVGVLVASVIFAGFAQYLWQYVWPGIPIIKGQPPGVYVSLVGVGFSLIAWWLAPVRRVTGTLAIAFLAGLAVLWAVVMVLAVRHGDAFTHGVWAYALVLLMLALKWPTGEEARFGILLSAWLLTSILVLTRFLEMLGLIPMATVAQGMIDYEQANYWLPLSGWLGPEGRWPGPFGHNANTGNIAAYLVVIGVALKRRFAWTFIAAGIVVLLLTMSRGSIIAALVGVGAAILLGDYPWLRRFTWGQRAVALVVGGLIAFGGALLVSPNLTGRTSGYWPMFLDLWQSSPWLGVGETGIEAGPEFIHDSNGHNIIIDMLARYGLMATIPLAIVLVAAAILGLSASARGTVVPLGIMTVLFVISVTEADFGWATLSQPLILFILATVMASGSSPISQPATAHNPPAQPVELRETS